MDVGDQARTVLLLYGHTPCRVAARSVVGVTPGFEVVGEAKSGEQAVEQVAALHPQLVLMDINMDGISGIEAARRITSEHPETRVILLSTYDAEDLRGASRSCGAIGYLHKEQFGPDVLVEMWSGEETGTLAD